MLHYITFMKQLLEKGYAERVYGPGKPGQVFYLPHHGVYHPKKLDKLRVVFNCSIEYLNFVLNHCLMPGPDLINNLIGVLCRFRTGEVAMTCDIEAMFHQVRVKEEHRDYLRFLWWDTDDFTKPPVEYRMAVHLFGATSSPGVVNFTLQYIADLHAPKYGEEAAQFIKDSFYVDDGIGAVEDVPKTIKLAKNTVDLCAAGGFRLHKFMSNSKAVLESIPEKDRAADLQILDLSKDSLPSTFTLGMLWGSQADIFMFRLSLPDKDPTRRGMLSVTSSIYDPLGLVSPIILVAKQILQDACAQKLGWDEPIGETELLKWRSWLDDIKTLPEIQIPRCIKPPQIKRVLRVEYHHFSDACLEGYGQCSYVVLQDESGERASNLVLAKARVTPTKPVTVPRLELTAAVISVRVADFMNKNFKYADPQHYYWTDSQVVLGYLYNASKRFHIYVANRVEEIRKYSEASDWRHVKTDENPADLASRGTTTKELKDSQLWFKGPAFLSKPIPEITSQEYEVNESDPELKKIVVSATAAQEASQAGLVRRLAKLSRWTSMVKTVALLSKQERAEDGVQTRSKKKKQKRTYRAVTVEELRRAEERVIKLMQQVGFHQEMQSLKTAKDKPLVANSRLRKLDVFLTKDEMLRIGGRIDKSMLPYAERHPLIVDGRSTLAEAFTRHYHEKNCHRGREHTQQDMRRDGYWLTSSRVLVDRCIWKCMFCRRHKGQPLQPKMAELPQDRVNPAPPFQHSAADVFGPYFVKQRRARVKRHVVLYVCMYTKATHLEMIQDLTSDEFINSFRRFLARRGVVSKLRCDRGTNFVGARKDLEASFSKLPEEELRRRMAKYGCDYVTFEFNTPHASNMGGIWERQIRTTRSVITALLHQHAHTLNDSMLSTILAEAEAIVNSRPLTVLETRPGEDPVALSPAMLLTLKPRIAPPPPSKFEAADLNGKSRWKKIQYIVDEFWRRWRNELLPSYQPRSKWLETRRNFQIGDIVLMIDDLIPRAEWPMARVKDVKTSADGIVRSITLRTQSSQLERPANKVLLLVPVESPS